MCGVVRMKLEEAHELIVKDRNHEIEDEGYFIYSKEDQMAYANLFVDLSKFAMGKSLFAKNIKKNPLVNKIEKQDDYYYIDTKFGDGLFFPAHEVFGKKGTKQFVLENHCHCNSMLATLFVDKSKPEKKPTVLTGICKFSIGRPLLHSVYTLELKKGRFIVDYTSGLAMTEDLYMKICNFKVLTETKVDDIKKLFKLHDAYLNYVIENKGRRKCGIPNHYFLLSNEGIFEYMNDVIEGKREDDFPFIMPRDLQEQIKNNKKR